MFYADDRILDNCMLNMSSSQDKDLLLLRRWQILLLSFENLYGAPPSMTCSGWVKPELGVTVPSLPSKLSGTI